jgi:hypothetical protein
MPIATNDAVYEPPWSIAAKNKNVAPAPTARPPIPRRSAAEDSESPIMRSSGPSKSQPIDATLSTRRTPSPKYNLKPVQADAARRPTSLALVTMEALRVWDTSESTPHRQIGRGCYRAKAARILSGGPPTGASSPRCPANSNVTVPDGNSGTPKTIRPIHQT